MQQNAQFQWRSLKEFFAYFLKHDPISAQKHYLFIVENRIMFLQRYAKKLFFSITKQKGGQHCFVKDKYSKTQNFADFGSRENTVKLQFCGVIVYY